MERIATATDDNLTTTSMGIDQTAAFDCVDHRVLADKLKLYGLSNDVRNWINSYLGSRSGFVAIGSGKSGIRASTYGVPQGSVLGPLLYLLYINEFSTAIEDDMCVNPTHREEHTLFGGDCDDCGSLTIFADDLLYLFSSNNRALNQQRIDDKFIQIRDFLNSNGLQINEAKTFLTEFMTAQKWARLRGIPPELTVVEKAVDKSDPTRVVFKDKHITDSKCSRTLGLNLTNNLSWEGHIVSGKKAILPGARRQLGRLYRLKRLSQ